MAQDISVAGLILAAGKGTRMRSSFPKVLHQIAGKSMLSHVTDCLYAAGLQDLCAVLGPEQDHFSEYITSYPDVNICIQRERNGTGGAVGSASASFKMAVAQDFAPSEIVRGSSFHAHYTLICAGDTPALNSSEIKRFIEKCLSGGVSLGVLGMDVPEPTGYGRLICDGKNSLKAIVEEKDASPDEKFIKSCNSWVVFAEISTLYSLLGQLRAENAQKEYYLTDCVSQARKQNLPVSYFMARKWENFLGVNNPEQLAYMESLLESTGK